MKEVMWVKGTKAFKKKKKTLKKFHAQMLVQTAETKLWGSTQEKNKQTDKQTLIFSFFPWENTIFIRQ